MYIYTSYAVQFFPIMHTTNAKNHFHTFVHIPPNKTYSPAGRAAPSRNGSTLTGTLSPARMPGGQQHRRRHTLTSSETPVSASSPDALPRLHPHWYRPTRTQSSPFPLAFSLRLFHKCRDIHQCHIEILSRHYPVTGTNHKTVSEMPIRERCPVSNQPISHRLEPSLQVPLKLDFCRILSSCRPTRIIEMNRPSVIHQCADFF